MLQVNLRLLGTSRYGSELPELEAFQLATQRLKKLLLLCRDAGAPADKKLKPANSVKVRHILCEKQSKV